MIDLLLITLSAGPALVWFTVAVVTLGSLAMARLAERWGEKR